MVYLGYTATLTIFEVVVLIEARMLKEEKDKCSTYLCGFESETEST